MSPTEKKAKSPARRKRLMDQAKKRRTIHERQAARQIRENRALAETAYRSERRFADNLKTFTKFLGVTVTLFVVFFHLYMLTLIGDGPGGSTFLVVVQGVLYAASTALAFALAYLFILGMEVLFDNADQTRETMELSRQLAADLKFAGETLSEIAEAQVDEEDPPAPGEPAPPPPPKALPVAPPAKPPEAPPPPPPPPEPPRPERPTSEAGDFLPLDGDD